MNPRSLVCTFALLTLASIPCASSAQENDDALQANKAAAIATVREGGYRNLITQNAANGKAPGPKLFTQWILDEINNDSAMRDEIGDEVSDIQHNGHNDGALSSYYTRDKRYIGRLLFKPTDLTIKCTGGKDGFYDYEAILKARDGFHGGVTTKSFKYTFKVRTEYFQFTKAYQVTVVSYPLYVGKTETEEH